jgi:reverse gyrase
MKKLKELEVVFPKQTIVEQLIETIESFRQNSTNSQTQLLVFEMVLRLLENAKPLNKIENEYYYEKGRLAMIDELNNALQTKNK